MKDSINIVLAGVGGQGTLVAGKLLGTIAEIMGLDVKVSEVHGMAQRGGSVITYVKMAPRVFSPVVEKGTADFILAFEELEALRWEGLLRENGNLFINTARIEPATVASGKMEYPADIVGDLRRALAGRANIYAFDALGLARDAGSSRAVNVVMTGAMSVLLPFPKDTYDQAIDTIFPEKLRSINHAAFRSGSDIMKKSNS